MQEQNAEKDRQLAAAAAAAEAAEEAKTKVEEALKSELEDRILEDEKREQNAEKDRQLAAAAAAAEAAEEAKTKVEEALKSELEDRILEDEKREQKAEKDRQLAAVRAAAEAAEEAKARAEEALKSELEDRSSADTLRNCADPGGGRLRACRQGSDLTMNKVSEPPPAVDAPPKDEVEEEPTSDIKELLVAMKDVQLEELVPLAEEWCQEQGAELLEEAGGCPRVLEFMDDFAEALGLSSEQRERLQERLGVEDQELSEAKQLARIKELETAPAYLAAKRFVADPAAERERQKMKPRRARVCISERDLMGATAALAEFRAAGGPHQAAVAPPGAVKKRGFQFDPPTGVEAETEPRKMTLKATSDVGRWR
eukprot:Skav232314  [mRNA]  locus=scaffold882:746735:757352:- [translate_table: standard]